MKTFKETEENNKIFREFLDLDDKQFTDIEWNEKLEETAKKLGVSVTDLLEDIEAQNEETEEIAATTVIAEQIEAAEDPVYGCDPYAEY